MRRKTILLFIVIVFGGEANAQDTIITLKGEQIPAKVLTITSSEIEYKKLSNPDGPSYLQSRAEISAIHYSNGTKDVFASAVEEQGKKSDDYFSPAEAPAVSSAMTRQDIRKKAQVIFYGLDFTSFSLVEPRRINEAAKIAELDFPGWNEYFCREVNEKTMMRWLKKGDVTFNKTLTEQLNKTADASKVVSATVPSLNMEARIATSLRASAAGDARTEGIGFLITVEYFNKKAEETSAYFTFFDIATRAVICTDHITVRKVEGSGLVNFWGAGLVAAMKKFVDTEYRKF